MVDKRLFGALSLCRKAGRLRMGADVVQEEVSAGRAELVLCCMDVAVRSLRQATFVCERNGCPLRRLSATMDELAPVLGRRAGILAVCDTGFARMLLGLLPCDPQGIEEE